MWSATCWWDGVVHRTDEPHLGTRPQRRGQLVGQLDHGVAQPTRQRGLAELEDGGPDLGDRGVELIHRMLNAVVHLREIVQPGCAGQAHADGVDPLDHPVVEIPRNTVTVIEHAERPHALVQAMVLNRDACCQGKRFGQRLVLVAESFGTDLVGQIEVAKDLVSNLQRNPKKRRHRGMVRGKPVTVGMLADPSQTQVHGVGDQEPEDATTGRTGADGTLLLLVQPDGQELLEAGARFVEHAESAIAGADQRTGFRDHGPEQMGQIDVICDQEDRSQEPLKLLGIAHPRVGHPPEPSDGSLRSPACRPTLRRWHNGLMSIRVFLLDDHELVREGIRSLLESDPDIEVVGEASTASEALTRVPLAKPDVAILDVRLEEGNGIEVCRDLRSANPELTCLMLTSFADDDALYASVMAGAAGYVLKQIKARDLIEDVKKVAKGESLMDPRAVARVVQRISNPPKTDSATDSLSPQEHASWSTFPKG